MIDPPLILYGLLIAPLLLIWYAQHRVRRVFRQEVAAWTTRHHRL